MDPVGKVASATGGSRRPRDAQRRRVYIAETRLGGRRLPLLDDCRGFAEEVVDSAWWRDRFPDHAVRLLPRFRPGQGARQAFFREEEAGATITLPRRYRTDGVVLHELVHWALFPEGDLPHHGRTFARVLLDLTRATVGRSRADALLAAFRARRVHVGQPARRGPDGRWHYGWDERIHLGLGRTLAVLHRRDGEAVRTTGVLERRGAASLLLRVDGARVPVARATIWDVRPELS
ncbi:MAG: hypothetical protein M5U14_08415 [Acidimicrobiia bacterium]|nr:hypothetical protein [Acidimicrobiia bacterium]